MCLMLYAASSTDIPIDQAVDLCVEEVEPARRAVRQWFSLPHVRFIGAHTGCSCGFPSVIADDPIEYYDGMLDQADDREADLRSVRALLVLAHAAVHRGGQLELLPVADGEESLHPKGTLDLSLADIQPETFFFNERFLYRVRA